jgi:hypothetical protein
VQDQVLATLSANQASITAGAITTAGTVGEVVTDMLQVVFILIFFLHSGMGIWQFLLHAVPENVRTRVDVAGRCGVAASPLPPAFPRTAGSTRCSSEQFDARWRVAFVPGQTGGRAAGSGARGVVAGDPRRASTTAPRPRHPYAAVSMKPMA